MVTFFLFVPSPPPVFMDIGKYSVVWILFSLGNLWTTLTKALQANH